MHPQMKASCSIFWLSWITSVAYLLGAWVFCDDYFVPQNDNLTLVNMIVFAVCITSAVLAACGCCLIFFDASNFVCVLCYTIPLLFVLPGLCLFTITKIGAVDALTNQSIVDHVIKNFKGNEVPKFLKETQINLACCGLYGPTDYRSFIYGDSCPSIAYDVPFSCVNLSTLFNKNPIHPLLQSNCKKEVSKEESDISLHECKVALENMFQLNATLVQQANLTNNDQLDKPEYLCKYADNKTAKIKDEYQDLIHHEGCLKYMVESNQTIMHAHSMFLVFTLLWTFIMIITFLKNWCNTAEFGEIAPRRSDSYLSQQTLIMEEIKAKPHPLAKVKKEL